jgi:hypothetical protein
MMSNEQPKKSYFKAVLTTTLLDHSPKHRSEPFFPFSISLLSLTGGSALFVSLSIFYRIRIVSYLVVSLYHTYSLSLTALH